MESITSNLKAVVNSYRRKELNSIIMPSIFVIEPTNHCNLKCIICPDKKHLKKDFMKLAVFQKIVLKIRNYAKTIYLHLHGEPLLHEHIVEMVRYCKQNTNAKVSLSTNAVLLNEELTKKLIYSGVDEIVFSLDSTNCQTFKKIKGANLYEVAINNVRKFFALKQGGKPHAIVKMVLTKLNKDEANDFVKEWSNYDCKIHLSELNSWANQLESYSELCENISNLNSNNRKPCADLWFKIVINYEGKVLLCCHDYKNKYIIGDLLKDSVRDIWNSEFLLYMRQSHINLKFDSNICNNCREWSTEQDEFQHFEEFSILPIGRP